MSHRSNYFDIIDKLINNELPEAQLSELELKMEFNSDLSQEFELQLNMQKAIQEQDIICLREKIHQITAHQEITNDDVKSPVSDSFNFGLAEESSGNQNFSGEVGLEEISDFGHTFPKMHLYQHLLAAKENIYQFYKEQHGGHGSKKNRDPFSAPDNAIFEDVQNALQENDLLDLRANLKQISSSVSFHTHTVKDIHNYVNKKMPAEQRALFEEKLAIDKSLADDVRLYQEIDLAIPEDDIKDLRASLQQIQNSSLKFSSGIKEIDGYIYNELTESEMTLFETELANNKELYDEIDLIKNIDRSIQEKDVMQLRNNLSQIATENNSEKHIERSISLKLRPRKVVLSTVAASLIMLIGLTGLFKYHSEVPIYQKFYSKYETTGISRSSNLVTDKTFALAMQKYNNQEYQSALDLLQKVISKDDNNMASHFYSAISLQELGKYKNAIEEYQVVVIDKDNLFLEQAEWYIGLCYIQTKEDKKAIKQFKKIVNGKGFYRQKAETILQQLN